ncbi:hypothetical protein M1112_02855 [Candidatus Parvarchaeota archaeon]|jgi:ABC-type Fe3+ transport system permease subunit|nr:hypothetical protein [Candidatus Parvarchaeota archaeon]
MSLVDKYKEELKSQGITVDIRGTNPKKDRTKLILIIVGLALSIPIYFLIFTNYNSCSAYAVSLSNSTAGSSSYTTESFSLKCGINSVMYSVSAALLIFIVLLILLKIFKRRKKN